MVKKLYRITLSQGYDENKIEIVFYRWSDDITAVHDDLIRMVDLHTDIDIKKVKWWQWK